ncbi:MAG TPA: phosphoribosyltransferase family protein [Rhizomicrobium sp.]|nr:phosphoribosyltransferase family protein [Rhizomicrobium sp.]
MTLRLVHSEDEIAQRIGAVAGEIVRQIPRVEVVVPILSGAFVFAADLLRALAKRSLDLPVEFLWLRSYGDKREGEAIATLSPKLERVRGKNILLIDGVLDRGHTIAKARQLLTEAGVTSVSIAVAVDKGLPDAIARADFALFRGTRGFLVGYGMDNAQASRGLPYIAIAD